MVSIYSSNNPYKASDHTFTSLVDNNLIFLNDDTQKIQILNGPSNFIFSADKIYGLRITDDVLRVYETFKDHINFYIVTSYTAYETLKKLTDNIIYLSDIIQTPPITNSHIISDRFYTFCNIENYDPRLGSDYKLDVYSDLKLKPYILPNVNLIEWTPESVIDYQQYNTSIISYSPEHSIQKNSFKSLNRIIQCFYFNQNVITNYPGMLDPDVPWEVNRLDEEFYLIKNTRKIFDGFYTKEIIKDKLINFIQKYI
jgi:hypothetical protein